MHPLPQYIHHPEFLDAEAVHNLQQMVQRHPSFQPARLLYLLGLYQLHDERFGAELRKAAICLPDRRKLFDLFDAAATTAPDATAAHPNGQSEHPCPTPTPYTPPQETTSAETTEEHPMSQTDQGADRTLTLIDSFLNQQPEPTNSHKPISADASVDYMSYLMQLEDAAPVKDVDNKDADEFLDDASPALNNEEAALAHQNAQSDTYFTETLARIYIKQGKYLKAIEIIKRISLIYPKKNRYFADQIRFLEKLIINERALNEEKQ